ncbi:hypothetical protein Mgra_00008119 [Meloidogyne graminicola]|uniref:Cellulose binding protein n=2 Tax=Meloidogyne graminicola TaxID=189291 RepID=A0A8S9ZGT0_9BILA|nr:hypothetical protein Mgra_00008119 [Meloidogyne graminicola]
MVFFAHLVLSFILYSFALATFDQKPWIPKANSGSVSSINPTVSISANWGHGGNVYFHFTNVDNKYVCALNFSIIVSSSQKFDEPWDVLKIGDNTYCLPTFANIAPGKAYSYGGMTINSGTLNPLPKLVVTAVQSTDKANCYGEPEFQG